MGDYERESARLQKLLDEIISEEEISENESEADEDNLEICDHASDSEESCESSVESNDEIPLSECKHFYFGRDKKQNGIGDRQVTLRL